MSIVGDVARLRDVIGRPEKDHSKLLKETLEHNNSLFLSHQGDNSSKSLLRQRSISSMLQNPKMDLSRLGSRRMTGAGLLKSIGGSSHDGGDY